MWQTYEADLDRNLTDLHSRVHRGAYRALAITPNVHTHEMHRREEAVTRAVMNLKHRLLDDGVWVRPTAREPFLMARDWRTWAETERDPRKAQTSRRRL